MSLASVRVKHFALYLFLMWTISKKRLVHYSYSVLQFSQCDVRCMQIHRRENRVNMVDYSMQSTTILLLAGLAIASCAVLPVAEKVHIFLATVSWSGQNLAKPSESTTKCRRKKRNCIYFQQNQLDDKWLCSICLDLITVCSLFLLSQISQSERDRLEFFFIEKTRFRESE